MCKTSHKGREGSRRSPHAALVGFARSAQCSEGQVARRRERVCFLRRRLVICAPERVWTSTRFWKKRFAHTHIRMHHGKTQVWNRASVIPQGVETLTRVAQLTRPGAVVWRGDDGLPPSQQGIKILGIPVGNLSTSAVSRGEVRRAPHTLPTHPHGGRPTGGLVALAHVRINQSQLLVERGPTRMDFDFR